MTNKLQNEVNVLQNWCINNKLDLNISKCKVVGYIFSVRFLEVISASKRDRNRAYNSCLLRMMGLCCDLGIGMHIDSGHCWAIFSIAKIRSGLYPLSHLALLNKGVSSLSWTRIRLLKLTHSRTALAYCHLPDVLRLHCGY